MTEEEIIEMGVKPKKNTGRAMTVIELRKYFEDREAAMQKKIEELENQCDSCNHHECECPQKIQEQKERMDRMDQNTVDLYNTISAGIEERDNRMDRLDENDEQLRQNINRAYSELSEKLQEEHRLRVESEEKVARLELESKGHGEMMMKAVEAYNDMEEENKRFANQNLRLGILAGACLGLCLCVLAFFMAG